MMDFDLYNKQILRLAASVHRLGRLAAPDASATAHSRLCGSRITIDLKLDGDVITDYAHKRGGGPCARQAATRRRQLRTGRTNMTRFLSLGLIWLIRIYQYLSLPLLGPRCRFTPSCSVYAIDALGQRGLVRSGWLTVGRVSRCHPWLPGGLDPVSPAKALRSGAAFR